MRRGHEGAEMFGPTGVTKRIEPRDGPRRLMCLDQGFDRATSFVDRGAGETGQKRQGRGAEAELEQTTPAGRLEVVVPLRHRLRDERDFPRVEPEFTVERRLRRRSRVRARQE